MLSTPLTGGREYSSMSCFIVIDYLERKYIMGIKVDSRLTQTENLNRLLDEAGIGIERRRDFESISIIEENRTVKGKQYNTQLQMHLVHGSPTHRKEKRTFATTVYNRMPVGWNNDTGYTFTYDETKNKALNRDGKEADLKLLATVVNSNPNLSHDPQYPFRVKVNEEYTELEVIPHLASPCYYGKRKFPLNIVVDSTNVKIFEDEIYIISAIGVPNAKLINSDIKETTMLRYRERGADKEITAIVIPYKQRVNGVVYKHTLDKISMLDVYDNIWKIKYYNLAMVNLDDSPADPVTTLLGIGKPHLSQTFSSEKINVLRDAIGNETGDELFYDRKLYVSSYARIYDPSLYRINKLDINLNDKHYIVNIIQLTLAGIIYKYLGMANPGDAITKNNDIFTWRTSSEYRQRFPEKEITFTPSVKPDGYSIVFTVDSNWLNWNASKSNYLLGAIRKQLLDKLVNDGMELNDVNYILGSSVTHSVDYFEHVKDAWRISERKYSTDITIVQNDRVERYEESFKNSEIVKSDSNFIYGTVVFSIEFR